MAQERPLSQIAADLRILSNHVHEYQRSDRLQHFAAHVRSAQVRAVRLFIEAVDLGAFPKSRAKENHGWFDRKQAALPCGRIFFTDQLVSAAPMALKKLAKLAMADFDDDRCHRSYPYLIAWLRNARPNSIRKDAAEVHLDAVATDRTGTPLGRDGKPARYILNGKRMPVGHRPNVRRQKRGFTLRLEAVSESYFYDQVDWINCVRTQCEVCEDACRLLAELIEPPRDLTISPFATETSAGLRVTAAANLLVKDLPDLTLKNATARVSKAANDGRVKSNGKKRDERRIDPVSFDAWRLQQRDRQMDKEDKLTRIRRGE